jgi:hypothetical protein
MKASRWAIVGIAGIGAAIACAYVLKSERDGATPQPLTGVSPLPSSAGAAHPAKGSLAQAIGELARAPMSSRLGGDLFAAWTPATQPAATQPAAATPTALPVFPYKYAGTLKNGAGVTEAFLSRGAELVPIRVGELLDEAWRVDALIEDRIEVTFVPASQHVSMLLASLIAEPSAAGQASQPQSTSAVASISAGMPRGEASAAPASAAGLPGAAQSVRGGFVPGTVANNPSAARATPDSSQAVAGASGAGVGAQTPPPASRLGSEPPAQGSMPVGPAPAGSFPKDPTPSGKLGL